MKVKEGIGLQDVQAVYSGPEGDLWELLMGEQIHIGGFASSMDLAERAGIAPGSKGVDLCCCTGAGMRFLTRFLGVTSMTGVDITDRVIERGRDRCRAAGTDGRIRFVRSEATATGLPDSTFDFAWGEDAWCYVSDKAALIREVVRLVRPGGIVAFTDWVEGLAGLSETEADRFCAFMKFPSLATVDDYRELLVENGCRVSVAVDTGRFAPYVDLYLDMLSRQLFYDVMRIIGFDEEMFRDLSTEMAFMQGLAREGRIAQGLLVANKPS